MIRPAYITDNPIMQAAFIGFMEWFWDQDQAHADFCEVSGWTRPTAPRTMIDAMIDQATGSQTAYAAAFAEWAIREHWGAEGDPRLDEEPD